MSLTPASDKTNPASGTEFRDGSSAPGRSPWDLGVSEAIALQQAMREQLDMSAPAGFDPRFVGGCDISMEKHGDRAWAGIVVIDRRSMETVDERTTVGALRFPYVPGLLSFRELPALEPAWASLARRPDVLIFDGAGYAHPRRFGLACHGGVLFGVPSIGCAKSILVGTHEALGPERGATAPLVHRGEIVGMAVRTRDAVQPVYVSIGHRMDLETAVRIVLQMTAGFREPETTRRAHRLVNGLRRTAARG